MLKILKRRRKTRQGYKYLKVYFEYNDVEYCREWREEFFLPKKTETWYVKIETTRTRSDVDMMKTFVYYEYRPLKRNQLYGRIIEKFDKAYEDYIFMLREDKLKRILDEI